jgi:hypothetical protein
LSSPKSPIVLHIYSALTGFKPVCAPVVWHNLTLLASNKVWTYRKSVIKLKWESGRKRKGGEEREDKSTHMISITLFSLQINCINNFPFVCRLITADYKNWWLDGSKNTEESSGELKIWS